MGITERREREKEALRMKIVEAARDIMSDQGLDALSIRAIAERIEYSPATIYLYFRDKDALIREVVMAGFNRMAEYMRDELSGLDPDANAVEQHRAIGRAYACFALENTAYFKVMFELPTAAQIDCPKPEEGEVAMTGETSFDFVVATVQRAIDEDLIQLKDAFRGAIIGWGLVHGLTSLFLSGHLAEAITTREQFELLIEDATRSVYEGWGVRPGSVSAVRETTAATGS